MRWLLWAGLVVGIHGLRLMWLSDFHLDLFYESKLGPKCYCHVGPNFDREGCGQSSLQNSFGMIGCDSPSLLIDSALEHAQSVMPQPDILLLTGDFVRHSTEFLPEPEEAASNATAFVLNRVRDYFPNVSLTLPHPSIFALSLGNDDFVGNYDLNESNPFPQLDRIARAIGMTNTTDQYRDFTRGGYMRTDSPTHPITILSLNSVLYSPRHTGIGSSDPLGQYAWLRKELQRAVDEKRKVIITGHIAPGLDTFARAPMWIESFLAEYVSLLGEYKDVVIAQMFGHLHRDLFRLMGGDTPGELPPILLIGSVSPVYQNFPSFRVLEISDKGVITDAATYYTNITDANFGRVDELEWRTLYIASQSYKLADLSPASLLKFGKLMLKSRSSPTSVAHTFLANSVATVPAEIPRTEVDQLWFLCTCMGLYLSEVSACVSAFEHHDSRSGAWKIAVGVLVPVGVVALVAVGWFVRRRRRAVSTLRLRMLGQVEQ